MSKIRKTRRGWFLVQLLKEASSTLIASFDHHLCAVLSRIAGWIGAHGWLYQYGYLDMLAGDDRGLRRLASSL